MRPRLRAWWEADWYSWREAREIWSQRSWPMSRAAVHNAMRFQGIINKSVETLLGGDVLVVGALLCFRRRGEDGFGQLLRFDEAFGEPDPVHRS